MKKIVGIVLIVGLLFIGFLSKDAIVEGANDILYQSPCETPIAYRIGTIDQEFNLPEEALAADMEKAAGIWNTSYGKPLFVYDPSSEFTISLKYDGRQALNNEINAINEDLEQKDNNLKPQIEEYKRKSATLSQQIDQLNQKIESWNNQGGAPPEEYDRLRNDQARLQQEIADINAKADELTHATQEYNQEVMTLDKKVDNYNTALSARPEGGLYIFDGTGQRIEIYLYDSRQELVHTLAHEMGHALGIDHVNNQNAIMFSRTNNAVVLSPDDMEELTVACQERNVLVSGFIKFSISLRQTFTKFINNFQH